MASITMLQGVGTAGAMAPIAQLQTRKSFAAHNGLHQASGFPVLKHQISPSVRMISRPVHVCVTAAAAASGGADAKTETLAQCQKVVAEQLGVDLKTVKPETKFSDLGADSLDTVEIVMALEEKFKISVEQEGAEKIVTVQDAADVIYKLISQKE